MNEEREFTVLVANKYNLSRKAIMILLSSLESLRVVGEAGSGRETVEKTKELRPDTVLVEMNFKDLTGRKLVARIKAIDSDIKVISLSTPEDCDFTYLSPGIDFDAYIGRNVSKEELKEVLEKVKSGEFYYPHMSETLSEFGASGAAKEKRHGYRKKLTGREKQILSCIVQG
ncbi:MAG: response regulator, partial [Halanaerobiales bacterium]